MNDVEVDAGASDDVGDAGGDEEGQAVGPGESRVCCEAAPVQSSPHCWRLPPPSGLRTLTLGVTAPSLPCSTTDFTKVGIFSRFLACREPPGHLAGGRWRFWAMQQIARQSQPLFWPLSRGGKREEKTKPIMT